MMWKRTRWRKSSRWETTWRKKWRNWRGWEVEELEGMGSGSKRKRRWRS